ncbi:MAG: hypothetical protein K9L98_02115 [Candidatus Pacebacteria bacterium]|nr:hypothetical protein [Candidatus Paceibacterota bacterium]MCF7862781.1 hypothetical protein [Candidatus Paceibacterota bacterium]
MKEFQKPIGRLDGHTFVLGTAVKKEIIGILSKKSSQKATQETLAAFVPERVRSVAVNPKNIELYQLSDEQGEISVLVLEKDYPTKLTDKEEYSKWKHNIELAKQVQERVRFKILPNAPTSVNKLHAKFSSLIDSGYLSLSTRVLMFTKVLLYPSNPEALFVKDFDGETQQGIGQDFYKNQLPVLAKNLGLRFVVGQNNGGNFTFFKDTLGRYTQEDLKPEFRVVLFPDHINDRFFTIQFLYPEDIEKYVQKEAIKS